MIQELALGEEYPLPNEEDFIDRIAEINKKQINNIPASRDQHPKQQGCVWAQFIVENNLPENLRVGIFKEPKTFPTWIRFSNFKEQDDSKGDIHGMAIKLMDVEGEKVLETEGNAQTQDFVLIDSPKFFIRNVQDYAEFFEEVDKAPGKPPFKFFFPSFNPLKWRLHELISLFLPLVKKKIDKIKSPLENQYWSTTPYRLGLQKVEQPWSTTPDRPTSQAIKFFIKPSVNNKYTRVRSNTANYLREAMIDHLTIRRQEACFDFYVQLQTDSSKTPIEDPTIEWKDVPEYKVATIKIPPQVFDSPEQMKFAENLSFTPWHCLREHEPLGGINRTRKKVYQQTSRMRRELNGVHPQEPTPEVFKPRLLQNPLTVLVPIKPEKVNALKVFLTEHRDRINSCFTKTPSTHFARWVILEDSSIGVDEPHLLFTSNYDGSFKSYVQELIEAMGEEMEQIWQHCKNYSPGTSQNAEDFIKFIQQYFYEVQAFYVACPGATAQAILKSSELRTKINKLVDDKGTDLKLSDLYNLSPKSAIPSILPLNEAGSKYEPWAVRVLAPITKLPFAIKISKFSVNLLERLLGIRRGVNNPAKPLEELSQEQQARIEELKKIEDGIGIIQNQMTTLSAIKSNFYSKPLLRAILWLISLVAQQSWGSLAGITTIHFARWVIIDQGKISNSNKSYLLFESNYGQSWDNYIEDFADRPTPMNLIFGNLENFPPRGCQDIQRFKQQIREHQFPAQIFYSAYPNLAVKNILTDLQTNHAASQLLQLLQQEEVKQFLGGSYQFASLTVPEHPLVKFVKSV